MPRLQSKDSDTTLVYFYSSVNGSLVSQWQVNVVTQHGQKKRYSLLNFYSSQSEMLWANSLFKDYSSSADSSLELELTNFQNPTENVNLDTCSVLDAYVLNFHSTFLMVASWPIKTATLCHLQTINSCPKMWNSTFDISDYQISHSWRQLAIYCHIYTKHLLIN